MAQYWNGCRILDIANEFVSSSRDAKVDVGVQLEEVGNDIVSLDKLQAAGRDSCGSKGLGDDGCNGRETVARFSSTLEDSCVSGFDG